MGKKRIIKKDGETETTKEGEAKTPAQKTSKKKVFEHATLYVQSTYNNTKAILADKKGNSLAWSSSGSLGFKGAKKGTPFAAAKVGELLGDKAVELAVKEVDVVVNGVGSGRESTIRGFISRGINLSSIKDVTPVPHNGPQPKKPRRV
jgi:small subunit ribosomal protein S11